MHVARGSQVANTFRVVSTLNLCSLQWIFSRKGCVGNCLLDRTIFRFPSKEGTFSFTSAIVWALSTFVNEPLGFVSQALCRILGIHVSYGKVRDLELRKPLSSQDPNFKTIFLLHDPILLEKSWISPPFFTPHKSKALYGHRAQSRERLSSEDSDNSPWVLALSP